MNKRDIPCFVSQPARVDGEPVARFVLGAFQAVLSGYATESLLEMLKTGVSGFAPEEIAALEKLRLPVEDLRGPLAGGVFPAIPGLRPGVYRGGPPGPGGAHTACAGGWWGR